MGRHPAFSIILAFRDPGVHFQLAIRSVFAQTFTDWELVLVDDGSTDGSLEFARSLGDPRIRVFSDGLQRNLNVRLNQLIGLARGEFIARMDADDLMHPERLAQQYAVLSTAPRNTVVGTSAWTIDINNAVLGRRVMRNRQLKGFAATRSFMHPTVAASAAWFRQHRYSESFIFHRAQDAELWLRTAPMSHFVTIEEPLLFYREVGNYTFEKYIGTQLGLLVLAHRISRENRLASILASSVATAKLWVSAVANAFGLQDKIVRKRYVDILAAEAAKAQSVLDDIRRTPLPVAEASAKIAVPV